MKLGPVQRCAHFVDCERGEATFRIARPRTATVIDAAGLEAHLIDSERYRQQVRVHNSRFRHLELRHIDSGAETKVKIIIDAMTTKAVTWLGFEPAKGSGCKNRKHSATSALGSRPA